MVDEVIHKEVTRVFENRNNSKTTLKWIWTTSLGGNWNDRFKSMQSNPELIIFNSLLLHKTRACTDNQKCQLNYNKFKQEVTETFIPLFKEILKSNNFTKILWLGSEDMKQKGRNNGIRREHNLWLREKFYEEFGFSESDSDTTQNRVAFMGVNFETAFRFNKIEKSEIRGLNSTLSIENYLENTYRDVMLYDGTHLMERRVETTVPTALWADANVILNFACNRGNRGIIGEANCCT